MNAVTPELIEAIKELQKLPSLNAALLGGGTNLAIRYGHRQSVDIDLFFAGIIGKDGFGRIEFEVRKLYGERAYGFDYPGFYDAVIGRFTSVDPLAEKGRKCQLHEENGALKYGPQEEELKIK